MPDLLNIITPIIKPLTAFVDDSTLSAEERREFQQKINELQFGMAEKFMEYDLQISESRSKVIGEEAKSDSWLAANWRPLTMLTFLVIILGNYFGVLAKDIDPNMWTLLQYGLGGYIGGRSTEKIVSSVVQNINRKK